MSTATAGRKKAIESGTVKPQTIALNPSTIPQELQDRPQWVAWRYERRGERWTKLPLCPATGRMASSTDPATWGAFDAALKSYRAGNSDGIGYVFAADDPYCGVDLDDCLDPDSGDLASWAATVVRDLDTYTEVSPSGTGVKVWLRAKLPAGGNRKGNVEMYDQGRYFAMTGVPLHGTGATIRNRQAELERFHRETFGKERNGTEERRQAGTATGSDQELLQRAFAARNGGKLRHLWEGDTSGHNNDRSAADLALCSMLAFWCRGDAAAVDRLFRQSGLMREKWDERRGERTYGQRTVEEAIAGCREFWGEHRNGAASKSAEAAPAFTLGLIDSATFAAKSYHRDWSIRYILVRGQPGCWAGPVKSMKTSTLVDAAISLASGTPFLGEFEIPQRRRVAVLSGESGEPTLQEIGRRVCWSKGLELADLGDWLHWGFDLPQLSNPEHVAVLQRALEENHIEVLFYDPLYLGLLAANPDGVSAANLYQTGPLLLSIAKTCLSVGCDPILAHHFKLGRKDAHAEPQLDDLAYSGIREFVRQWVLLSRRSAYDPDHPEGLNEIWLSAGGSAGHSTLRAVNIREGRLREDFSGRIWAAEVFKPGEARTADGEAASAEQRRRDATKDTTGREWRSRA